MLNHLAHFTLCSGSVCCDVHIDLADFLTVSGPSNARATHFNRDYEIALHFKNNLAYGGLK